MPALRGADGAAQVSGVERVIRDMEREQGPLDDWSKRLLRACWGAGGEVPPIEEDPLAVELGIVPAACPLRTAGAWYAARLAWEDGETYWSVFAPSHESVDPGDPDVASVASHLIEGDARLISAAPDLLEACRALVRFNQELCADLGVSRHYPSAELARRAIAKASGGTS